MHYSVPITSLLFPAQVAATKIHLEGKKQPIYNALLGYLVKKEVESIKEKRNLSI